MKKLSVLIAMILCVTIGGVYATWYYSGADNVADTSEPVTINLEDSQTVGSHGSYTLHKALTGETFFRIDQADENHTAKLVCKGELVLEFKPAEHASAAIKGGTFDTWIYFTGNIDTITYDSKSVFESIEHPEANKIKITWTVNSDGNLECDITDFVVAELTLANTFTLDTLSKYNDFAAALDGVSLTVHVTDGIVAGGTSST